MVAGTVLIPSSFDVSVDVVVLLLALDGLGGSPSTELFGDDVIPLFELIEEDHTDIHLIFFFVLSSF